MSTLGENGKVPLADLHLVTMHNHPHSRDEPKTVVDASPESLSRFSTPHGTLRIAAPAQDKPRSFICTLASRDYIPNTGIGQDWSVPGAQTRYAFFIGPCSWSFPTL